MIEKCILKKISALKNILCVFEIQSIYIYIGDKFKFIVESVANYRNNFNMKIEFERIIKFFQEILK